MDATRLVATTGLAHLTAWGWFWLAWILTALAVESYWLVVNTANTLSEEIWGAEQLNLAHPLDFADWSPLHWAIAVGLWGLFGWFSVHFPFGWIR